jgi:sporadic carbohydrate cluster 2OG-Fe(II) oxygenase|tara:strand:+ start:508 stop:1212 length:705 start_codon:yes stop_codon:yes gene_type:complete
MDLKKELIFGKGYSVFSIEKMDVFENLRSSFVDRIKISNTHEKRVDNVRKSLAKMSKAEINRSMINLLSFTNLSEMMINSCSNIIELLCGKELFIQRRAHTIINVPGEGQAKQWTHYELMSGISPFTYVIWAPLHDLDDQGGVYYIDLDKSSKIMKDEEKKGIVNGTKVLNLMDHQKPTKLKFGQAIIFNPFVLHGNIAFESNYARIACNVRFQSFNKPLLQKNSDYLKYYKLP